MNTRTIQSHGRGTGRARSRRVGGIAGTVRALTLFATLIAAAGALTAQTPDDAPIRELIARLDKGETEAVRQELPELVARYQNHPGILYVQARVATDGIESAKLYQSVLDNYPSSEWADDALYNLYQYYYAMGLYKTAELKMQQLRKEYPASEHLGGKSTPPGPAVGENKTGPPPPATPAARDTLVQEPPARETGREERSEPPTPDPAAREAVEQAPPDRAGADAQPGANDPVPVSVMPYALQTGAFSTSENARKQKEWFEDRGYAAEITNRVRGGRSLYLVWVGNFRSPEEARKVLAEIQSRYNITPIVVER